MTADYLLQKMKEDASVVAITSATPTVFGFTKDKREQAGRQFVDVGIAEEHAVALASGLATGGAKPVYGVYSTFYRDVMTSYHRIYVSITVLQQF